MFFHLVSHHHGLRPCMHQVSYDLLVDDSISVCQSSGKLTMLPLTFFPIPLQSLVILSLIIIVNCQTNSKTSNERYAPRFPHPPSFIVQYEYGNPGENIYTRLHGDFIKFPTISIASLTARLYPIVSIFTCLIGYILLLRSKTRLSLSPQNRNLFLMVFICLNLTRCSTLDIVAGSDYTCILIHPTSVKCFGQNTYGELGYGDTDFRGDGPNEMGDNLPDIDLGTNFNVIQLAAGNDHTCALSDTGTVKCFGNFEYGKLGYEDEVQRGDNLNEMGDNLPEVDLGHNFKVLQIATGTHHTCALSDAGTVKCWGRGRISQLSVKLLGYGDGNDRGKASGQMGDNLPIIDLGTNFNVTQIALAKRHTCALSDENDVKCWGDNEFAQCGYGTTKPGYGDVPDEMGDNLPIVDLGTGFKVKSIAANGYRTCAISQLDTLKCFGQNIYGALGYGDTENRGDGANEMGDNLPEVDLGTGFDVIQIAGYHSTCALSGSGLVKCFGHNNYGQLGLGDEDNRGDSSGEMGDNLLAVDLGTNFNVVSIAGNGYHVCALSASCSVKCFGLNDNGQLGLGDTENRGDDANEMGDYLPEVDLGTGFDVIQIVGYYSTCALSGSGLVKCFGRNHKGQLGVGDEDNRGDHSGQMGESLLAIDLGTNFNPVSITSNGYHVCAVSASCTVKCWGENSQGELGSGNTDKLGNHDNEMGNYLPEVDIQSAALCSSDPTVSPFSDPTAPPSDATVSPSSDPSASPSSKPTIAPSLKPTVSPSSDPTVSPSSHPTVSPSTKPTPVPSANPTLSPSAKPTAFPSSDPTSDPSPAPTVRPTQSPTNDPSRAPTKRPSPMPTLSPTTPKPTPPGTLSCGSIETGEYNGEILRFTINLPHKGDLIFDASASLFDVTAMEALDEERSVLLDADSDNDELITLYDMDNGNYVFSIYGGTQTGVQYEIRTSCPTPQPSSTPTYVPTLSPTSNPTRSPTPAPTQTLNPTIPTKSPVLIGGTTSLPSETPTEHPTSAPFQVTTIKVETQTSMISTITTDVNEERNDNTIFIVLVGVVIVVFIWMLVMLIVYLNKKRKAKSNEKEIVSRSVERVVSNTSTHMDAHTVPEETRTNGTELTQTQGAAAMKELVKKIRKRAKVTRDVDHPAASDLNEAQGATEMKELASNALKIAKVTVQSDGEDSDDSGESTSDDEMYDEIPKQKTLGEHMEDVSVPGAPKASVDLPDLPQEHVDIVVGGDDKKNEMGICTDCTFYKIGTIYEGNGCFYCSDCWSSYVPN
eukprot:325910_1